MKRLIMICACAALSSLLGWLLLTESEQNQAWPDQGTFEQHG
ncbi:MAG: hypothetical protein QGG64_06130 [Candidatus Latescibacteria bacterium]|jgi:hypothetical protein|nr:hypothetical protein [Candidatus Latescibacterota bacterium]